MSREAFEAWATASGYESKTGQGMDYPLGRALWIAWQAATAAALEEAAKEADHWQKINGAGHRCGEYIAGAIRALKEKE